VQQLLGSLSGRAADEYLQFGAADAVGTLHIDCLRRLEKSKMETTSTNCSSLQPT
jgi:hypothetical protein